ncbi:hypothetical protein WOLCODRAFT_136620, partial [Wolfiporia cocos MD-104 SS10]
MPLSDTRLGSLCAICFSELQSRCKGVSKDKIKRCCIDLCLVAMAVRTGYLFDTFVLRHSQNSPAILFHALFVALCELDPVFKSVILVEEPESNQLFFVNVGLLRARCVYRGSSQDEDSGSVLDPWMSFVHLLETPTLMPTPPAEISTHLLQLCRNSEGHVHPLFLKLSSQPPLTITQLIPLAAFLLEYPAAYVPSSVDEASFLPHVQLDVYECSINRKAFGPEHMEEADQEHVFLKFSCPSNVGSSNAELSVPRMLERLTCRFAERFAALHLRDAVIV